MFWNNIAFYLQELPMTSGLNESDVRMHLNQFTQQFDNRTPMGLRYNNIASLAMNLDPQLQSVALGTFFVDVTFIFEY